MINKLRKKFIALSMISLTLLLAAIVTGMNVINYNTVVRDADIKLEVLEHNPDGLKGPRGRGGSLGDDGKPGKDEAAEDGRQLFGRDGKRGNFMTSDEAEESRYFSVVIDSNGNIAKVDTSRISAVDDEQAEEYAKRVLAEGNSRGFADEYRYSVLKKNGESTVTFLDCGRVLKSFRDYMTASMLMSLVGLLVVFVIIAYFSGRIVRPVAESYEKQKRFITDAGHEIKTPLAIIKANLDVIKMDPGSTDESLGEIEDQVNRLAGLTNDLVYLSRMEEGSTVMTELPLSDVVSDTASSFNALAESSGKTIESDVEPMIFIRGNVKDMEKLVSILMENAVKYSAGGEPIRVSLKRSGNGCILQVANKTGAKISEESMRHIFDRFYRTDSSRNSETGGYGIGLSMASAIVTSCGGRISASNGSGDEFIIKAVF